MGKSKLILFPLNSKKPRKGDATAEELSKAVQLAGAVMPVKPVVKRVRAMEVTDDLKKFQAFQTIRQARAYKRLESMNYSRSNSLQEHWTLCLAKFVFCGFCNF